MTEVCLTMTPIAAREAFAQLLTNVNIPHHLDIYTSIANEIAEDYYTILENQIGNDEITLLDPTFTHNEYALADIHRRLQRLECPPHHYLNLPLPPEQTIHCLEHYEDPTQNPDMQYLPTDQQADPQTLLDTLTPHQREIFDEIMISLHNRTTDPPTTRLFFLDGPAGTGKSYTINTVYKNAISRGYKVTTAATTGIAATLIPDALTMHKTFGLPLQVNPESTSSLSAESRQAQSLAQTDLFIIDEISIARKEHLEIAGFRLRACLDCDQAEHGNW